MKPVGALLLISGWLLVLCALSMLNTQAPRNVFVMAGIGVQILGLILAIRAHLPARLER